MLGQKFIENEPLLPPLKKRVKTVLDWTLQKPPGNLQAFIRAVEKENVSVVLRQNKQGTIYGITYIDHKVKAVLNGSDIGKEYSAKAILERFPNQLQKEPVLKQGTITDSAAPKLPDYTAPSSAGMKNPNSLLDILIEPVEMNDFIPYQLKGKKKKRKKRLDR